MTSGLQFQTFYTYSNTSDSGQSSQTFTASNNVLNPFNLSLERGRSNFDITIAMRLRWFGNQTTSRKLERCTDRP